MMPKFTGYFDEDYKRRISKNLNEILKENNITLSENEEVEFIVPIGSKNSINRFEIHSDNGPFKTKTMKLISANYEKILDY